MWIAREDKTADADPAVFFHTGKDLVWVVNACCSGTSTYQTYTGPEVGADFQLVATAAIKIGMANIAYNMLRYVYHSQKPLTA